MRQLYCTVQLTVTISLLLCPSDQDTSQDTSLPSTGVPAEVQQGLLHTSTQPSTSSSYLSGEGGEVVTSQRSMAGPHPIGSGPYPGSLPVDSFSPLLAAEEESGSLEARGEEGRQRGSNDGWEEMMVYREPQAGQDGARLSASLQRTLEPLSISAYETTLEQPLPLEETEHLLQDSTLIPPLSQGMGTALIYQPSTWDYSHPKPAVPTSAITAYHLYPYQPPLPPTLPLSSYMNPLSLPPTGSLSQPQTATPSCCADSGYAHTMQRTSTVSPALGPPTATLSSLSGPSLTPDTTSSIVGAFDDLPPGDREKVESGLAKSLEFLVRSPQLEAVRSDRPPLSATTASHLTPSPLQQTTGHASLSFESSSQRGLLPEGERHPEEEEVDVSLPRPQSVLTETPLSINSMETTSSSSSPAPQDGPRQMHPLSASPPALVPPHGSLDAPSPAPRGPAEWHSLLPGGDSSGWPLLPALTPQTFLEEPYQPEESPEPGDSRSELSGMSSTHSPTAGDSPESSQEERSATASPQPESPKLFQPTSKQQSVAVTITEGADCSLPPATLHGDTQPSLTLQQALLLKRPDLLRRSESRVKQLEANASERRIQALVGDPSGSKSHSTHKCLPQQKLESTGKRSGLSRSSDSALGGSIAGSSHKKRVVTFSSPVLCKSEETGVFTPPDIHRGVATPTS